MPDIISVNHQRSHIVSQYQLGSRDRLWEVSLPPEDIQLGSLLAYRGAVRQSILDFKIGGQWQLGMRLAELFADDLRVLDWVQGADALMPIPSSLWSRHKGRFDLAHLLAQALSERSGIRFISPPWQTFFRWQKQAFLSRGQREPQASRNEPALAWSPDINLDDSRRMNIILIDDIVTTANTLTAFSRRFRNTRLKFLTLASAFRSAEAPSLECEREYDWIASR